MKRYLINVLDALSQLGNAVFFAGDCNHSISGDAYRLGRWQLMFWIDAIFKTFGQRDHCRRSHEADVAKARALVESDERLRARELA